ncbi:hypothetical protein CANINC_000411 [Pichia inconspicua]|uniref:Uncharacterized protein n=1 Tax=Pichia inconspicua TaxID=52247 RepID=A0A4V6TTT6_9ASCO|nr:hypothetical protein CANINC_000411 [[Candida] inconspicua]
MYTFKLSDPEVTQKQITKVATITPVEFSIITKDEGYDQKKFTKIQKPKYQQNNRKPRNVFLMFRGLVRLPIKNLMGDISFENVSKLSSSMWAKRTADVENYMKYLAKQDEIYWENKSQLKQLVSKRIKNTKSLPTSYVFISDDDEKPNKRFRHYRIEKPTTKLIVRSQKKSATRVQDVFISQDQ